jgi:hypothetical protein
MIHALHKGEEVHINLKLEEEFISSEAANIV